MDTLNLTINGSILFALGFVVYAVVYELCASVIARKATAQFSGHAFAATIPSFVKPASGLLVNLPKQNRSSVA